MTAINITSPKQNHLHSPASPTSPTPLSNTSIGSLSKTRASPRQPQQQLSTRSSSAPTHLQQQQQAQKPALRKWPLALACGMAIMVSLMTYSILQERIMTRPYTSFNIESLTMLTKLNKTTADLLDSPLASGPARIRVDKPSFFQNSLFLVLANRLFAAAVAGLAIIIRRARSDLTSKAPLSEYAIVSLSNVIATSCQYEALKWLTFPTVTIGKCAKMLPVMLILNLRQGKKYTIDDYSVVAIVLIGCSVMISSGSIVAQRAASSETDTPVGFILLIVYLLFDAITSTYQEKLFSKYEMSVYNQMLFINVTSATISMAGLALSGGLRQSLHFLIAYPAILRDITMLSLSAVAGQFAISYTIQTFGALLYAGIMTTRQLFSVLLSDIIFKHGLTVMQWFGALMVFSALFYKLYRKAMHNDQ